METDATAAVSLPGCLFVLKVLFSVVGYSVSLLLSYWRSVLNGGGGGGGVGGSGGRIKEANQHLSHKNVLFTPSIKFTRQAI